MTITHSEFAIGEKLGKIVNDPKMRAEFVADPAAKLEEVGVKPADGMEVYADTADMVHLVVPTVVDESRIAAGDETYFEELGLKALGACYYEIDPE